MRTIWLTPCLPTEQIESDILGEKTQLEEAKAGIADLHKELDKLQDKVNLSEVGLSACAYHNIRVFAYSVNFILLTGVNLLLLLSVTTLSRPSMRKPRKSCRKKWLPSVGLILN